jgi:type IV pilus assembly protein PilM
MANFFSNLFKKNDASVLGIDIGASAIKIVQLKMKGGKVLLETYGALSLGPYAKAEIGRATNLPVETIITALNDILREAKTTTKKGGVAIPFGSSLMSVVEMPLVPEKQLAQMIPLEARKYIPVPITEVSLDWSIIPRDQFKAGDQVPSKSGVSSENTGTRGEKVEIQKVDVLLVAIHNETIRDYQEIIKKTELDANFFEIEIFSTIRSVLDQNIEPVMILDMGAASTKLYIVERGAVRVSHTINRGSQDVTTSLSTSLAVPIDKAEIIKRTIGFDKDPANKNIADSISLSLSLIFSEGRRVALNYQAKYNKSIEKVLLVGGGAAMKGFSELAQKNLEMPVVLGDPFSKVEAPAFLTPILKQNGPEFAVALGVAIRRLQES